MVCIYCYGDTKVVNSRHQKRSNSVWRRRKCLRCEAIFTSIETVNSEQAVRVRRHNHYEPFSRDKLLLSVYDSLRHRKTATEDATALTATIESQLFPYIESATLERDTIAEIAATVLERFDKAAATSYRAFHPVVNSK